MDASGGNITLAQPTPAAPPSIQSLLMGSAAGHPNWGANGPMPQGIAVPLNTSIATSAMPASVENERISKDGSSEKGKKDAPKRKARKAVKKKPDDMPRRPLSAYNYFFSEMRTKLVAERAEGRDIKFQEFLEKEGTEADVKKKNGFFSCMGKYVARRWKELSAEEMKPFTELADADLQRYRREMDEYREGVARKTRLASEQKLKDQAKEPVPSEPTSNLQAATPNSSVPAASGVNPNLQAGPSAAAPVVMSAPNALVPPQQQMIAGQMSQMTPQQAQLLQPNLDPFSQLLLRQQVLGAQNPQLSTLFLQQQFGGAPALGGLAPQTFLPNGFGAMLGQPQDLSGANMDLLGGMAAANAGMFGGMFPMQQQLQQQAQQAAPQGQLPQSTGLMVGDMQQQMQQMQLNGMGSAAVAGLPNGLTGTLTGPPGMTPNADDLYQQLAGQQLAAQQQLALQQQQLAGQQQQQLAEQQVAQMGTMQVGHQVPGMNGDQFETV